MIMWLIELAFLFLIMRFIEEIGLGGSCILFAILHVLGAAATAASLSVLVSEFIIGIVAGVFAYFVAKFFLFLIRVLGGIGKVLIGLFFVLAILAIIF